MNLISLCIVLFFIFTLVDSERDYSNGIGTRNAKGNSTRSRNFQSRDLKNNTRQLTPNRRFKSSRSGYSRRQKITRRERHRHSTRVLRIKPSIILLPPIDTNLEKTTATINPFIINVLSLKNLNKLNAVETTTEFTQAENFVIPPASILEPPIFEEVEFYASKSEADNINNSKFEHNQNITEIVEKIQNSKETSTFPQLPFSFELFEETTKPDIIYETTQIPPFSEPVTEFVADANFSTKNYQTFTPRCETYSNCSYVMVTSSYFSTSTITPVGDYNTSSNNKFFNNENMDFTPQEVNDQFGTQFDAVNFVDYDISTPKQDKPSVLKSESKSLITAETGDFRSNLFEYELQQALLDNHTSFSVPTEPPSLNKAIVPQRNSARVCDRLGYVADISTGCKVFYICTEYGLGEPMLCPNGTLFNQDFLVCDWWYNVEC